jgi:hypothetical protein
MACNQNIRKKDLDLVKELARKFAIAIAADVRVYKSTCCSIGEYYDFEPAQINRGHTDVIEIVQYVVLSTQPKSSEFSNN